MIELVLRIGFSLVVVFLLMWGLAKLVRRPLAGRGNDLLGVIARQQMTRGASVAVVRIADRALIVGVTDTQVTLLGEADLESVEGRRPAATARAVRTVTLPVLAEPLTIAPTATPVAAIGTGMPADAPAAPAPVEPPVTAAPAAGRWLAGSALSPHTWTQTIEFLRERTVRK